MPLQIAAFGARFNDTGGRVNIFPRPGLGNDEVNIAGASDRSAVFPAGTKYLKLDVSADCRVAFGDGTVVAVATSEFFRAGEHIVAVGSSTHLAAIAA